MTSPPPTPERATPRWRKAGGRLLALVARPVRRAQGTGGTVIEAYRGYGSSKEIFLIGRVFGRRAATRTSRPTTSPPTCATSPGASAGARSPMRPSSRVSAEPRRPP